MTKQLQHIKPLNQSTILLGLLLFVIFGLFQSVTAQNSVTKNDSLEILNITKGLKEYYTNPLFYRQKLPSLAKTIDSLLKVEPNNKFLLLQKAIANDYLALFNMKKIENTIAFNMLQESIIIKEKFRDTFNLPLPYRGLSMLFFNQRNYVNAKEALQKALQYSEQSNNTYQALMSRYMLATYNNGSVLDRYDEKDQNIYINRLIQIAKDAEIENQQRVEASIYYSLASAYSRLKDQKKVYEYAKKSEYLFKTENDILGQEKTNWMLANHYRKIGQFEKSANTYKASINIIENLQDSVKLRVRYLGLSNTYKEQGNYKGAYEYYLKYKDIDKKLISVDKVRELTKLETEFEYEKQKAIDSLRFKNEEQKKLEVLEYKNSQTLSLTIFIALGLLTLAIIGYLLFRQRALKAENALMLKNQRNLELQEEITKKTHEVSSLVSETVEHLSNKERLTQNLKQLALKKEGVTIQSILMDLKVEKLEDDKSIILKKNIAEISADFISNLKEHYPQLSKTDIEIASFMRLGLSRKEIANLRNTSTEAVKKSRYRLKNKLNLEADVSIDDFIKSI